MGKKINNSPYLLLLMLMLSNMHSHSQELFTKELQWKNASCDSVKMLVFEDKDQILEWGKNQLPFSSVYSGDFRIKSSNIFILRVAGCSGLPCWNIYIFKEKDEFWQLIMMSIGAKIREPFTINVDNDLEKIIFRTKSGKIISELSYNVLDNEF